MILFVVPAYNEELNIARLIKETSTFCAKRNQEWRLFVVDDGSRDRTAEVLHNNSGDLPVSLVSYQPNRGVQEAFRRGFKAALDVAKEHDVIVTMEADGTADLELIPRFLEAVQGGADVVVASYYAKGGSVEGTVWHRKLLSRAANLFVRTLLPIKGIHTYSSFYRAYRPRALRAVLARYGDFYESEGFSCVVELLYRMHLMKLKTAEVPMVLCGSARVGKSKMKIMQTIFGYLRISARGFAQKI